ncbi:MAG: phage virion morphogenesis protein [Fibrobacter sp.]|nr:phage virion morphogenesis protein [Fibrobacter sp.]
MSNFINADVKIDKFNEIIDIAKRTASDLKPAMAAIGNLVAKSVKQNFREGGRPVRWPSSKKPKGKTLVGTGALMKGIHYELDSDGNAVTVMTGPQKYAHIHQFGGSIPAHDIVAKNRRALRFTVGGTVFYRKSAHHPGANIPARPYMLLQEEDETKIKDILANRIVDEMKKKGGLK